MTSGSSTTSPHLQFLQLFLELLDFVFLPHSELLEMSHLGRRDFFFFFWDPCSMSVISDWLSEMLEDMSKVSTLVAWRAAGLLSVVEAVELFLAKIF